jgi:hypothetical protein
MMAKCAFRGRHFHDAAVHYRQASHDLLRSEWRFGGMALLAAAEAYKAAELPGKARKALEECCGLDPCPKGAHKQLAELEAQNGDYLSAYENLKKEVEIDPEQEEVLGVRVALALGKLTAESFSVSENIRRFLSENANVTELIDGVLSEYWQGFRRLSEQGREEWRTGTCALYYFTSLEPRQRVRLCEDAAKHFAKTVEIELRERVFERFREEKPDLEVETSEDPLTRFLFESGHLTLGDMARSLAQCDKPQGPVYRAFEMWLKSRYQKLIQKAFLLKAINEPRKLATHEALPAESAAQVADLCRQALELIAKPA